MNSGGYLALRVEINKTCEIQTVNFKFDADGERLFETLKY